MEPQSLLQTAVVLFGLAALGGIVLTVMCLAEIGCPPKWLGGCNTAAALTGLAAVGYVGSGAGVPSLSQLSCALMVVAALAGFGTVYWQQQKSTRLPASLVVIQAFIAGLGFVFLVTSAFGPKLITTLTPIAANSN